MRTTNRPRTVPVGAWQIGLTVLAATILLLPNSRADSPAPKTVPSERGHIVLPTRTDSLPFSDAVMVGNTLYLAGKIGIDPKTGQPPAEVEAEIRLLLDGVKATLAAVNLTMDDLISVQVFCPDLSLYEKFNEIYRTYFTKNFPARAFVGSGPLLRGGRFEVQGIAVKR
ncbi:hypothetical protein BH20VER1_BH20VER1_25130 [soil metagenome]